MPFFIPSSGRVWRWVSAAAAAAEVAVMVMVLPLIFLYDVRFGPMSSSQYKGREL
jgi:anti-sigma-K factor RskA